MRRIPVIAALLLAAACGGGSDDDGPDDVRPTETPATSSTTAAPTPTEASPSSPVIDYGDDEVSVGGASDAAKLGDAPPAFRDFVVAELDRKQAGQDDACPGRPEIRVARIDPRGWAAGSVFVPQCGGEGALWAISKGGWREVWTGQTLPECTVLDKYRFPAAVAGTECATPAGGTRRYP